MAVLLESRPDGGPGELLIISSWDGRGKLWLKTQLAGDSCVMSDVHICAAPQLFNAIRREARWGCLAGIS
jgi:hypothetical protein